MLTFCITLTCNQNFAELKFCTCEVTQGGIFRGKGDLMLLATCYMLVLLVLSVTSVLFWALPQQLAEVNFLSWLRWPLAAQCYLLVQPHLWSRPVLHPSSLSLIASRSSGCALFPVASQVAHLTSLSPPLCLINNSYLTLLTLVELSLPWAPTLNFLRL